MPPLGPLPRFRIYTSAGSYWDVLSDLVRRGSPGEEWVARLEKELAALAGTDHAVAMPQARVGIYAAVKALVRPGQEVVLSPYTIYDVVNMVICAGGVPVFCDIERDTCNLDAGRAMELAGPRTGAILVTHLHGLAADTERLAGFCRERGIALIEDAAQAFGTRVGGKLVGGIGDAGIYSFGLYKNVNTFMGGMLVTSRKDVVEAVRREFGSLPEQPVGRLLGKILHGLATDVATWPPVFRSITFRLFRFAHLHHVKVLNRFVRVEDRSEMRREMPPEYLCRPRSAQARLALRQLKNVDGDRRRRIEFARSYHQGLSGIPEIRLPPLRTDGSHGYSYFPIQYRDRESLVRSLMANGCDLAVQHLKNCADLEAFREYFRDCPNARATAAETILLPTYPRYSPDDVERNIRSIRSFFGRKGRGDGP